MLLPVGVFGIESEALDTAVKLLSSSLVVVWLALVYYTYADARRRIADPMLVACATAASLFPFVGTIVYMIVRPPEFLDDVRERELEMQAAEARLQESGYLVCPHCDAARREGLPALPELHAQAQGPVHELRAPAGPAVAGLPVLRGRGARARSAAAPAPAAFDRRPRARGDRLLRGAALAQ